MRWIIDQRGTPPPGVVLHVSRSADVAATVVVANYVDESGLPIKIVWALFDQDGKLIGPEPTFVIDWEDVTYADRPEHP